METWLSLALFKGYVYKHKKKIKNKKIKDKNHPFLSLLILNENRNNPLMSLLKLNVLFLKFGV